MKSVYRENLFYGIQHLENFLLIFFLAARLRREAIQIPRRGLWIAEPAIGPAKGRTRWAPSGASQ
jgi:hypothetical protein